MLNRVKQLIRAATAKVNDTDAAFAKQYLSPGELALFQAMSIPDQRHALNVAYTARRLAAGRPVDLRRLTKAALLHDVGRERGDMPIAAKVIAVLAHRFFPNTMIRWAEERQEGKSTNLRHSFYVYFHHPERGATRLLAAGTDAAIVEWVRKHHKAPAEQDPPELQILRDADTRN